MSKKHCLKLPKPTIIVNSDIIDNKSLFSPKKCAAVSLNSSKRRRLHQSLEPCKKFDYKNLLTANLNLADMVNEGKGFYFDCPPIDYNF